MATLGQIRLQVRQAPNIITKRSIRLSRLKGSRSCLSPYSNDEPTFATLSTDYLDVSEIMFHLLEEHPHQYCVRSEANKRGDVAFVECHRTLLRRLQNAVHEAFVFAWSRIHHPRFQHIKRLRQRSCYRTLKWRKFPVSSSMKAPESGGRAQIRIYAGESSYELSLTAAKLAVK